MCVVVSNVLNALQKEGKLCQWQTPKPPLPLRPQHSQWPALSQTFTPINTPPTVLPSCILANVLTITRFKYSNIFRQPNFMRCLRRNCCPLSFDFVCQDETEAMLCEIDFTYFHSDATEVMGVPPSTAVESWPQMQTAPPPTHDHHHHHHHRDDHRHHRAPNVPPPVSNEPSQPPPPTQQAMPQVRTYWNLGHAWTRHFVLDRGAMPQVRTCMLQWNLWIMGHAWTRHFVLDRRAMPRARTYILLWNLWIIGTLGPVLYREVVLSSEVKDGLD